MGLTVETEWPRSGRKKTVTCQAEIDTASHIHRLVATVPFCGFAMLETERTILRPWTEDDAGDFLPVFGDEEAMRFWNTVPLASLDDMKAMISRSRAASPEQHLAFAVVLKEDGKPVGMVNFHHREPKNRRLEIGFIAAPLYQRRGLTLEAVTALVSHCFAMLNTHRIEALTDPRNAASRALLERAGFKQEGGRLRQRIVLGNGLFGDQIMYSRLSDDY